jgi:succinate dehydrogenase/fumarate reductase iron-sulfur protein
MENSMIAKIWQISLIITRKKGNGKSHEQTFSLEVDPDEYVLDAIERIWAFQDRSLTYRHACHHSTCGACGMIINGVEKLTCITPIRSVTSDRGTIKVDPLRNFEVLSDLVVDTGKFFQQLEATHFNQVSPVENACLPYERKQVENSGTFERLVDCIECGLCISACPVARTSSEYVGPAVLAAAQNQYLNTCESSLLDLVDNENGAWRCHSAYECTEVCPSNVDPAWRIMNLRRSIIRNRICKVFKR